jgi:hypothetical protein
MARGRSGSSHDEGGSEGLRGNVVTIVIGPRVDEGGTFLRPQS